MSTSDFFDAARKLKRELAGASLTQAEVDAFNAIIETWHPAATSGVNPTALTDEAEFFKTVQRADAAAGRGLSGIAAGVRRCALAAELGGLRARHRMARDGRKDGTGQRSLLAG
ncbi:MAG: hypothetical protein ACJ8FS_16365 [Sphingomicrobium sp.]